MTHMALWRHHVYVYTFCVFARGSQKIQKDKFLAKSHFLGFPATIARRERALEISDVCLCVRCMSLCQMSQRYTSDTRHKDIHLCLVLHTIAGKIISDDEIHQLLPSFQGLTTYIQTPTRTVMEWQRLVGSLRLHASFAKEPNKRDDILQKRRII